MVDLAEQAHQFVLLTGSKQLQASLNKDFFPRSNPGPNQHTKMARIVLGIVAVIASFMLVDSLTCNKCSLSLLGYCISSSTETCADNTTTCFTAKACKSPRNFQMLTPFPFKHHTAAQASFTSVLPKHCDAQTHRSASTPQCSQLPNQYHMSFPKLPDFAGFSSQGCGVSSIGCNATGNDTLLTFSYNIKSECCSGDKCNPINLTSDAPATKLTFTAAIGAALLASVWGSMQ
ncbi:uncharacterized protein LOC117770662 [Hippoglossus hippoglossus]|uniref:uncharacterized protein LOC117770662 n=1 Tax=Hippoglossus hippoglossus TaxID=8267 RepID=UPI00148D0389|nr:uncharacterized protein LOC117770662 [Hippoglossus hippoglossus]